MAAALDLSSAAGRHAADRLNADLIAWLTTVQPNGQPDTVPVWFLWQDGRILVYSRPNRRKLRNIARNPRVSLVLDGSDSGHDVVRIEGTAQVVEAQPPASEVKEYVEKYAREIRASFGTPDVFARSYSVPINVAPTKIHV